MSMDCGRNWDNLERTDTEMCITSTQRGPSVDSNPGTSQKILSEIKKKKKQKHVKTGWKFIYIHNDLNVNKHSFVDVAKM